jgi:hypothetical protein
MRRRSSQAELDFDELRDWRDKFPALKDIHREFLGDADGVDAG